MTSTLNWTLILENQRRLRTACVCSVSPVTEAALFPKRSRPTTEGRKSRLFLGLLTCRPNPEAFLAHVNDRIPLSNVTFFANRSYYLSGNSAATVCSGELKCISYRQISVMAFACCVQTPASL